MGVFDQAKTMMQLKKLQKELQNTVSVGEAAEGKVKVEVNGEFQIKSIDIDPELLSPDNKELVERYLITASHNAMSEAKTVAAEKMKGLGGLGSLGL